MSQTYPYDAPQWESDQENLTWVPGEPNFLQGAGTSYPGHSVSTADTYQTGAYSPDDTHYTTSASHAQNPAYVTSPSYQYPPTYDNNGTATTTFIPLSTPANSSGLAYHGSPYGDSPYSPSGTTLGGYSPSTVMGTPAIDSYLGENPNPPYHNRQQHEAPSNGGTRPPGSGSGFQCPECEKVYPRRRDLERHIHARHPQVPNSASEYVTCPVCGRDNMRRDNWQRHMRHRHPTYRDTTNIQPRIQ